MNGPKTVLVVEDDPGILHVLGSGLATALDGFDIVTASNGQEAIEELERRSVDVLVTDLAMPILDGFALIGYVTNRRSTLPVIVLSGMAPHAIDAQLAGFGGLRVLRKPTAYRVVAEVVREEIARVDRGQVEGIPLAAVLQLVESERRTCTVVVRSGRRRGSLHFESGRLVNAFSDDFGAEGEAAAFDILGWNDTAIGFDPLPHDVRRLVTTSLQRMLIELAAIEDYRARTPATGNGPVAEPSDTPVPSDEAPAAADQAPTDGVAPEREGRPSEPAPMEAGPVIAEAAHAPHVAPPSAGASRSDGGDSDARVGEAPATAAGAPVIVTDGDPVGGMIAAIERLTQRAREADAALAAVAVEVEAFHEARRRFDAVQERQQRHRRELEAFGADVGRLAREILGRLDVLFDAMAAEGGGDASDEAVPAS